MPRTLPVTPHLETQKPSPLLRRFATRIVSSSNGNPILDIACGSGRNAIFLASTGCDVVCVDSDLTALRDRQNSFAADQQVFGRLRLYEMNLLKDPWPFGTNSAAAIINVHFLLPALLPFFENSLAPGGYLVIESIPAHGGNYLKLPQAGQLRSALKDSFDFEFYKERKAGPGNYDAVTVQTVARRR
jgi:SAM-dependent methyltransferase